MEKTTLFSLCPLVLCALSVLACESEGPTDPWEEWESEEFEVDTPEPPTLPELTPCPEGWTQIEPLGDDDVGVCEPWPDGSPAAAPSVIPCPEGWREVREDGVEGVVACHPWPEGGPRSCGIDEAHFPGDPGCTRVGTACPGGDWADDLPTDVRS